MPQPHEQKLHEVVNSLTSESFKSFVAARIAGTSRSPPTASPAPPPTVSLNRSLRVIVRRRIASVDHPWVSSVRAKQAHVGNAVNAVRYNA